MRPTGGAFLNWFPHLSTVLVGVVDPVLRVAVGVQAAEEQAVAYLRPAVGCKVAVAGDQPVALEVEARWGNAAWSGRLGGQ